MNKKAQNPHASYHLADTHAGRTYYRSTAGTWTLDKSERALYSFNDAHGAAVQIIGPSHKAPRVVAET